MSGEASAKAQEEALEAEKKAWRDKVVVDTIDFKVNLTSSLSLMAIRLVATKLEIVLCS